MVVAVPAGPVEAFEPADPLLPVVWAPPSVVNRTPTGRVPDAAWHLGLATAELCGAELWGAELGKVDAAAVDNAADVEVDVEGSRDSMLTRETDVQPPSKAQAMASVAVIAAGFRLP